MSEKKFIIEAEIEVEGVKDLSEASRLAERHCLNGRRDSRKGYEATSEVVGARVEEVEEDD